jgi:hypothetical protein
MAQGIILMLVVTTNALVCQVNVDVDHMFPSLRKYNFFHVASKFLLLFIINLIFNFLGLNFGQTR